MAVNLFKCIQPRSAEQFQDVLIANWLMESYVVSLYHDFISISLRITPHNIQNNKEDPLDSMCKVERRTYLEDFNQ